MRRVPNNHTLLGCIAFIILSIQSVKSERWDGNTLYDLEGSGTSFTAQANTWFASSLVNPSKKASTCGTFDVLGGYLILNGGTGIYFERTFTGFPALPAHNQISIKFLIVPIDNWQYPNSDHIDIMVDTITVSSFILYHNSDQSTNRCGTSMVEMPPVTAYIKVPHTNTTSVTIRMTQVFVSVPTKSNAFMSFRDLSLTFETVDTPTTSVCGRGGSKVYDNLYCLCESSQYMSPAESGTCYDCHSSCTTCSGSGSTKCTGCADGKYLTTGKACASCSTSCATCAVTATQCLTCRSNYFYTAATKTCTLCDPSCATCAVSATQCLTCRSNYFYTAATKTCTLCDPSCATCDGPSASQCLTCYSGSYLVNNNTCLSSCNSPFFSTSDGTQNFCDTPCPSSFAFESGVCKSGCDTLYRSEVAYILKACYCDNYEYWNSSCLASCDFPLTNTRTQGIRKFCDFPCASNEYLYFNASCKSSCDPPFAPSEVANNLFCDSPCASNEYLYADGSCKPSCDFPFVSSVDARNNQFCDFICASNEYLYLNTSCKSSCDFPLLPSVVDNNSFCDSPCASNEYLYADGSCKPSCDFPFVSSVDANNQFCDFICASNEYLYLNTSCKSACDFPLLPSVVDNNSFCDSPCASNEYLYADGSCKSSCDFPLVPSVDAGNLFCQIQGCEAMEIRYVKATSTGHQYKLKLRRDTCSFEPAYLQDLLNTNNQAKRILIEFSFNVSRIQGTLYLVDLTLRRSLFQDQKIMFQFSGLSAQIPVYQKLVPSDFAVDLVAAAHAAQVFVIVATGSTFATTLFTQTRASVWGFIGFQLLINYYKYINVKYPYQMESLFELGGGTNFNRIPNVLDKATQSKFIELESDKALLEELEPPYKFMSYEETSIFIKNGGSTILMNFGILLGIYFLFWLRKKPRFSKNAILEKIDDTLRWNCFLRTFLTSSIPLGVAIFLQLRTFHLKNEYLSGSGVLTIFALLYFVSMCAIVTRIIYKRNPEESKKDEWQKRYGTLAKGVGPKSGNAKYYDVLILIRGLVISIVIVFAKDLPLLQILLIMLVTIGIVYLLFKKNIFEDPRETRKTRITEALLLPTQLLICCLTAETYSDTYYDVIGWLAVSIVGVMFLNEITYIVLIHIEAGKKIIKFLQDRSAKKSLAKVHHKIDSSAKLTSPKSSSTRNMMAEDQSCDVTQRRATLMNIESPETPETPSAQKLLTYSPGVKNLRPSTALVDDGSSNFRVIPLSPKNIRPSTALADGNNFKFRVHHSSHKNRISSIAQADEEKSKPIVISSKDRNLMPSTAIVDEDVSPIDVISLTSRENTEP